MLMWSVSRMSAQLASASTMCVRSGRLALATTPTPAALRTVSSPPRPAPSPLAAPRSVAAPPRAPVTAALAAARAPAATLERIARCATTASTSPVMATVSSSLPKLPLQPAAAVAAMAHLAPPQSQQETRLGCCMDLSAWGHSWSLVASLHASSLEFVVVAAVAAAAAARGVPPNSAMVWESASQPSERRLASLLSWVMM
mmetsp:Transcript_80180/g.141489  ORF Transcript_80180/g.141489 Transcript_80180/m.141489 type:complete len:200 (-) Transcript_80180:358-957(-)